MLPALAADFRGSLVRLPRIGIRARMGERVEVVSHDDNAPADRDLRLDLSIRIAGAVPALVVGQRDLLCQLEDRPRGARQDLRSDHRVALHQLELSSCQAAWLEE